MPVIDQRFSTAAAFDRTTVMKWATTRNLKMFDEWFTHGTPHKRLAEEALRYAAMNGWLEGTQRVWASGWLGRARMLDTLWYTVAHFGGWRENRPANAVEDWAVALTWDSTDEPELAAAQKAARVTALAYAMSYGGKSPTRWDRFAAYPMDLSCAGGHDLLDGLLRTRFALHLYGKDTPPSPAQRVELDRRLDQLLAVPEDRRAALNPGTLPALLWRSRDKKDHDEGAWPRLQQLMAQSRPGIGPKDRAILACQLALVGELAPIPSDRMDHLFGRLLTWGLPASVTFSEKDLGIGGAYRGFFDQGGGHLNVVVPGQSRLAASFAERIDRGNPSLFVGDHWFYGRMRADQHRTDQPRAWNQRMTEDERAWCRNMLTMKLEALALETTFAKDAHRRQRPVPIKAPRSRL